jgi:NhaP-type Na+/H+ or K+/H+ antiporter
VNPLHRSRAYPSHDNVCHWSPKLVDLGVYAQTVDLWTSIDPHLVMYTFLPPLIYGATVHVNVHVFKKSLGQVLPLAGPGVLLATFLTASFTKLWIGDEYNWSVWAYLTFGAMLSATDPVAVVALLSESSAPQKLGIVIEGESLFNDGTALALFLLCFEGIKGKEEDLGGSIVFFTRLALGGMIMGVLSGKLMLTILKYLQEPLLEVIITLVFSYVSSLSLSLSLSLSDAHTITSYTGTAHSLLLKRNRSTSRE